MPIPSKDPTKRDLTASTAEELLPLAYDHLRALARSRLRSLPPGQTLQPTALVHEAYLRIRPELPAHLPRAHFYAAFGQAMRNIIVDQIRRKRRVKRGGDHHRVDGIPLDELQLAHPEEELLEIDRALSRLESVHAEEAQLVKLRFFSGLSMNEISEMLEIPYRTLTRRWRFARAWLQKEMARD